MEPSKKPISVRTSQLNSQLVSTKTVKNNLISRDGLLDALTVLYDECNNDRIKKSDRHINDFVNKQRVVLNELRCLRVNISDFELKNVIGRGHFGEVIVVKEKQTGDVHAMKILKKSDCLLQKHISYEEERNIMAGTKSIWLTKLQYAFQDSNNLYFVMEYFPGGDLSGLLLRQGGTIPESAACFYIAELVLALHDLHGMGYVHRDVKPENILLDRCGHVKLADFGSSARLNANGCVDEGMPVGTPDYIAPEVLQCMEGGTKKGYGIECDYWSVGVLGYQMTVGTTPFVDLNTTGTYSKIMGYTKNLKFPPDIVLSQAFTMLIKGLLCETSKRLNYEQVLKHPLFKHINFNGIRDQVSPYVPKIESIDDTSNFCDIPSKKNEPNIDNFKVKTQFCGKNLPFVGFTYTYDLCEINQCITNSNSLGKQAKVEELQNEIKSLQKQMMKNEDSLQEMENIERKLIDKSKKLENLESLRNNLERDLANSIAECGALKRTLELERKDRLNLEHKALELIKSAKLKWETSEKNKVDNLNLEITQQKEKIQQLTSTNALLNEQLQHALQMQHKHKDSVELVEHLNRKSIIGLEARLEKVMLETQNQVSELQNKLADEIYEKNLTQNEVTNYKCEQESLREKLKLSEDNCNNLMIKLESNQKLIRELQYTIDTLEENARSVEEQKNKTKILEDEIVKLRNEQIVAEWEQKFKMEKEANANLQRHIKELKEELNTTIASRNSSIEQQKIDYAQHLQEVQDQLSRTLDEANQLELKLQEAKTIELNTKLKVQTLEDLLQRLESGVSRLENDSDKDNVLKEQVTRLEQQLIQVHENLALEKQEHGQLKTKFWRVEKDLNNAEIDKRIFKRELKEAEDKNKDLALEIENLKLQMSNNIAVHQTSLTELGNLNDDLANEIIKLKDLMLHMEDKLKTEKDKCDGEKNSINQLKMEVSNKEMMLASKVKELEICKHEKNELCRVIEVLKNEKQNLCRLGESSAKERNLINSELEACRRELRNTQLNLKALREACTLLENQLIEYENIHTSYEKRQKSFGVNTEKLIKELAQAKEQIQEAKRAANEERSLKLMAETHCKRLMEDVDCLQKECASYKQQCVDFREYSSNLTEEVSAIEEKVTDYEVTIKTYERQISSLVNENTMLKEEASELLTNLNSIKDSNYKLGLELTDVKKTNAELIENITEVETALKQKSNYLKERELKADSTIQQQIKLIDFLQAKVEDSKKKKTLSDKLFGNSKKENQPPTPVPLNYKDLENMLLQEKDANKSLRQEIAKLKSELNLKQNVETATESFSPRTKMAMEKLTESPSTQTTDLYRQNSHRRMYHNIPHRFESKLCTKSTKCAHCTNTITLGRSVKICTECNITAHSFCAQKLPKSCSVPPAFVKHYSDSMFNLQNVQNETEYREEEVSIEGWIKIPVRGRTGWERHYACLTPSFLKIYGEPPNNPSVTPIETLELKPPNSKGIVILEPVLSEINIPIAVSDLPFVIKVQINFSTTCWPSKNIIIMTLSVQDKEQWSKALTSIFQAYPEKYEGKLIMKHRPNLNINYITDLNSETKLFGTEQGLYSFHENQLLHIIGPLQVYQISIIPKENLCLMITDSSRYLISCDLNHLSCLTKSASCSKPTLVFKTINVNNFHGFHLFEAAHVEGDLMLSVATSKQLIIMCYNKKISEFFPIRILDTAEPTSCMLFTEHSLIVGANKYFEIDLNNFSAEEFLDLSDKELCQVLLCYAAGSFPIAIIKISNNPIEYLLCFNEFGIFIDEYGRHSRLTEIKWNRLPQSFYYYAPYLHIVQFASVEIIKITPETCNARKNSVDSLLNVDYFTLSFNNVQSLGCGRRGVYFSSAGDVKYLEGRKVDADNVSISSSLDELKQSDNVSETGSEDFSFTSSMVQSLDGHLSDTETDSRQSEDAYLKKRVTFDSRTTNL